MELPGSNGGLGGTVTTERSEDRKKLRDESEAFAAAHMRDCAEELLEWSDTALLRDGKVRELARLCAVWAGDRDALPIAERIVQRAALRAVMTTNVGAKLETTAPAQK